MRFSIILVFLLLTINSFCQSHSFYTNPDTLVIYSKVFGTIRQITVSIPNDYQKIEETKNCIIYLDGDDEEITGTILQAANNLYLYDDIPQSILVGIIHQNRDLELQEKTKLFDFLTKEVIPKLSAEYNLQKEMTIVGHSFGAYFATYCFLTNNSLFNNCIAISPAYWPNEKDIFTLAAQKIKPPAPLSGSFYLAIGDKRWDDISLREDVFRFKKLLEKPRVNFRFQFTDLIGFNHNSSPTVGFGLGLNFCFDQWEWAYVVVEQNNRIESFPDFWQHYELKGDALKHLHQQSEAIETYKIALDKISLDQELSNLEKKKFIKRIRNKMKGS